MREQGHCADRPIGTIEQCREFLTLSIGEVKALGRHDA